jgi:hypothetical protein
VEALAETRQVPAAASSRFPGGWLCLTLVVYAAASIVGILHHEPWRDEAQAWFIARDCPDLSSLIRAAGYEGHTILWHLVLMPLARSGLPFFSAALVHFGIILAALILFLRHAPFSLHQKALFVFGYYVLYEYNLIVRNYALSVLVLFALASLHPFRFKKPIAYAALIALLANTHLLGLVIALLLALTQLADVRLSDNRRGGWRRGLAVFLIAAGIAASVYQLWPPADVMPPTAHRGGVDPPLLNFSLSIGHLSVITRSLVGAFLPLPEPGPHFWNSRLVHVPLQAAGLLDGSPWAVRWAYGTLLVLPALLSVPFLARKTIPGLFYLGSVCSLLALFFLVYEGGLRHYGFIFLLFIFALWISRDYPENRLAARPFMDGFNSKNRNRMVTALLLVHVAAAAVAFHHDIKYDFSSGRRAAAFLQDEGLINARTFIAAYPSKIACSALVHIKDPAAAVFMVEYQRMGAHMVWNKEYMDNQALPVATVIERVDAAVAGKAYERVVLITNSKTADRQLHERYQLIASFPEAVDRQESFRIYELRAPLNQKPD